MSDTIEFLEKIRKRDGLKNAILCGIEVDKSKKEVEFQFVTDRTYTALDETFAIEVVKQYIPTSFFPKVKIKKRVPDQEILKKRIYAFMNKRFPAASSFLKENDIHVERTDSGANFFFDVPSGQQSLFTSGKILDEVSAYLSSGYCGAYYGNVRIVEKKEEEEEDFIDNTEEEIDSPTIRYFEVTDYKAIDGVDEPIKYAEYIVDTGEKDDNLTVCGVINYIQEKATKAGKPFFSLTISDGTGSLRAAYFTKKNTLEKVRELKVGDYVVLCGANEEFNGNISYMARKINYGRPPEDFVPVARKGKKVPKYYHTIFPEQYIDYTQSKLFDDSKVPDDLKNNTFVVFDLETTGLNSQPSMGKMDKIIEIGAVKIINGNISEKFSSFIACPDKLPEKIIEVTGIHDEDLVGAPTVDKVLADFYKFTDGCFLVGHNVMFDYGFIRYYGEENRYMFNQKQYDTLVLAQELLRGEIKNFKLDTIAEYYEISFNHHRAFDDALTTAKIFMELIKKRGKLPI